MLTDIYRVDATPCFLSLSAAEVPLWIDGLKQWVHRLEINGEISARYAERLVQSAGDAAEGVKPLASSLGPGLSVPEQIENAELLTKLLLAGLEHREAFTEAERVVLRFIVHNYCCWVRAYVGVIKELHSYKDGDGELAQDDAGKLSDFDTGPE